MNRPVPSPLSTSMNPVALPLTSGASSSERMSFCSMMDRMYFCSISVDARTLAGVRPSTRPRYLAALMWHCDVHAGAASKSGGRSAFSGVLAPHAPTFPADAPHRHSVLSTMAKTSRPIPRQNWKHMSMSSAFDVMRKKGNPSRHTGDWNVAPKFAQVISINGVDEKPLPSLCKEVLAMASSLQRHAGSLYCRCKVVLDLPSPRAKLASCTMPSSSCTSAATAASTLLSDLIRDFTSSIPAQALSLVPPASSKAPALALLILEELVLISFPEISPLPSTVAKESL
mmetsp:Transcript_13286/g.31096  ORF Transcript_13286/g.31096 Transcript_13286/m.31096 type:complete len:285 (-) Transcript_13286:235-1089(-)